TLLRQMYDALAPGDGVLADALFDNYFLAYELRQRGVELVARVQAERVGSRTVESGPDGDVLVWQRPNKPRGMTGEQYRRYPESLTMRQVSVDARDKNHRAERSRSSPPSSTRRSTAGRSASCTSGGGRGRSLSARSSPRWGWVCCGARRPRWSRRRSGPTCWR